MNGDTMHTVKVLGPGCRNCERLTAITEQALTDLGRTEQVEKITDPAAIVSYGVYSTPALVVDDEVLISARIPGLEPLKEILGERLASKVG
jgi:small redox-active disulfide protein 2